MTYQHLRTESDVRAVAMENPEGQPVRLTPQAVYCLLYTSRGAGR